MNDKKDSLLMVINGLSEAANKASFATILGAGALGCALWGLEALGASGAALYSMSAASFFLFAKIGIYIDTREKSLREQINKKNNYLFFKTSEAIKRRNRVRQYGNRDPLAYQKRGQLSLTSAQDKDYTYSPDYQSYSQNIYTWEGTESLQQCIQFLIEEDSIASRRRLADYIYRYLREE